MKMSLVELPIPTRDGFFLAHYSERGLAGLDFPKKCLRRGRGDRSLICAHFIKIERDSSLLLLQIKIRTWHRATTNALKKILAGGEPKEFPPLDLDGTEFQKSVWNALRKISPGKTKSYGEIAQAI